LLNPPEESDPQSDVVRLKDILKQCDGLLIVADVPRGDKSLEAHSSYSLRRLREAFASLQTAKHDVLETPVGVIFTKWDRQSEINHHQPNEELHRLEEFLNSPAQSIYDNLVKSVSNALTQQFAEYLPLGACEQQTSEAMASEHAGGLDSDRHSSESDNGDVNATSVVNESTENSSETWGLRRGNCLLFPVSAFGHAHYTDGKDTPAGELRPFGILEPLVWLADRRDQLDAAKIQKQWTAAKPYSWLPLRFLNRGFRNLRADASRLARRMAPRSKSAATVTAIASEVFWAGVVSLLITAVIATLVVALSGWATYEGYHWWQFNHYKEIVRSPRSNPEQLVEARRFFEAYRRSCKGFVIAPKCSEADSLKDEIDNKVEKIFWSPVEQASSPEEKYAAAEEYLKWLPSGRHAAECRALVDRYQGLMKNADWLRHWESELNRAKSVQELENLQNKFGGSPFPHPSFADKAQQEKRQELLDFLAKRLKEWRLNANENALEQLRMKLERATSGDLPGIIGELEKFTFLCEPSAEQRERLSELRRQANERMVAIYRGDNDKFLGEKEQRLEAANASEDVRALRELLNKGLPYPGHATPEQKVKVSDLRKRADERYEHLQREEFVFEHNRLRTSADLMRWAEFLPKNASKISKGYYKEAVQGFLKEAVEISKDRVSRSISDKDFSRAYNLTKQGKKCNRYLGTCHSTNIFRTCGPLFGGLARIRPTTGSD